MDQFVVPQFIEVEDKIFGPVTTRQFLILLIASGFIFIAFKTLDLALFGVFTFFFGGFALILAFVKVRGQAFHFFLLNVGESLRRPSLRVWHKSYTTEELKYIMAQEVAEVAVEKEHAHVTRRRIHDLSLMVNTGGYYKGKDDTL